MKRKIQGLLSDGLLVLFALLLFWYFVSRHMERVDAVEDINEITEENDYGSKRK